MGIGKGKSPVETGSCRLERLLVSLVVIACTLSLLGCGSAERGEKTVDNVSEPGVTQPPPPDPNSVTVENQRDKKRKERPINESVAEPEPATPKPAPENSEASAMMNSDGSITEIRVFNNHPQIARAEARWMEPSTKDLKVFLRNGKILDAKTDRIQSLNEASSDLILEIVGLKPSVAADRPRIVGSR